MGAGLIRKAPKRPERLTWGLAALAVATAGTVVVGELAKLAKRRTQASLEELREADEEPTRLETAEHAIIGTQRAASDTFTVVLEGIEAAPRQETALFNLLSGFLGGFALMRLSTWGMRGGWWPTSSVVLGGRHIHHFVPGILLAFAAGGTAIMTQSRQLETTLAIPFGAGVGMTFDEAALLLDLRDVYWTREGILSVQISFGFAALLGATILALRILRRGEQRAKEQGLIPLTPGNSA